MLAVRVLRTCWVNLDGGEEIGHGGFGGRRIRVCESWRSDVLRVGLDVAVGVRSARAEREICRIRFLDTVEIYALF